MTRTLFEKDIRIRGVTTLGHPYAQGLNDPVRIKILEILSHKQMTAEEISRMLRRSGFRKAMTTIRHHLDSLKNAGLIEVSKIEEVRGATKKYYMPTLRAFSYSIPNLEMHSKLIEDTSLRLLKVIKNVIEDQKFAAEMNGKGSCNICRGNHYKEYAALEIINKALARVLQHEEYQRLLGTPDRTRK
ncbi:MAG: helix-turn-helix domain-containing protein [Thermoproteota archaeon]|nr:helix-turn-helix domain-containing protein [Thermoproteota archaeon]